MVTTNTATATASYLDRHGGRVSPTDVSLDWDGCEVIVSWRYCDAPWIVAECEATWEPGDRSVGIGDGFIVEGDWVPEDVASLICEAASDRRRDRYEDAQDQDGGL